MSELETIFEESTAVIEELQEKLKSVWIPHQILEAIEHGTYEEEYGQVAPRQRLTYTISDLRRLLNKDVPKYRRLFDRETSDGLLYHQYLDLAEKNIRDLAQRCERARAIIREKQRRPLKVPEWYA